jgi:hypothetical protein
MKRDRVGGRIMFVVTETDQRSSYLGSISARLNSSTFHITMVSMNVLKRKRLSLILSSVCKRIMFYINHTLKPRDTSTNFTTQEIS